MRNYYIGIDTETTNSYTLEDGKLELKDSLCYDVGWMVLDKKGRAYKKRSFVVAEIFLDKELMKSAYYAEKIPAYWEEIKRGERKLTTFRNINWIFKQDCKNYNVKAIFAHNAFFDYNALNNTLRFLTGSKYRYFYPYKIELWDTLKMARQILREVEEYTTFCWENEYLTKNMRIRYTAEIIYRWLSGNADFEESHTGLEDVKIERVIFEYCMNKNPEVDGRLWSD